MGKEEIIKIHYSEDNKRKEIALDIHSILYVSMKGNNAFIHVSSGDVYQTRMRFSEFEKRLGANFIRLSRGCLASAMAIHSITDKVNLSNGETLDYVAIRKNEILEKIQERQEAVIRSFKGMELLSTVEQYRQHYQVFDKMPFAFADIEMVFDKEYRAIDWIFCYGNPALAELEKIPLEKLIGSRFGSLFPNMDAKWLRNYERATLYGETLKIIDYSPEIDAYLEVVCFPTFEGHCGCILLDISKLHFFRESSQTDKAMALFLDKMLRGI